MDHVGSGFLEQGDWARSGAVQGVGRVTERQEYKDGSNDERVRQAAPKQVQ